MSRRSDLDQGSVTGGLINEAYNSVKRVADNIDEILSVGDTLLSFNSTFYAPRAIETDLDDLGDPSTSGDSYFNTALKIQRVYNGSVWQDLGDIIRIYKPRATETFFNDQGGIVLAGDMYFNTTLSTQRIFDGTYWRNMGTTAWYYAPRVTETLLRDDGSATQLGDTYYNTTLLAQRVYNGATWQNQGSVPTDASAVNIVDAGGYYAVDNVENALQEVGAEFVNIFLNPLILKNDDVNEGGQITLEGAGAHGDIQFDQSSAAFRVFGPAAKVLSYDTVSGALVRDAIPVYSSICLDTPILLLNNSGTDTH